MDMDYTPNSYKYKEKQKNKQLPEKKIEKVVHGTVKTKKPSLLSSFVATDVKDISTYIISDVLVPAAKKAISDIVSNGIDMFLYGETKRNKSTDRFSANYVSYRDYSSRDKSDRTRSRNTIYSYDDIVFETRSDAEEVLDKLNEIIDTYDKASVSDLYDLVGKTCDFTGNDYGWSSIGDAEVLRTRDGWYQLRMPRVKPLK